ncbi:hypothetical protein DBV15_05780 [Temnothorax longispinosus]|uniref:Uncharacterized protein n=1 Tax=Temnothorax longispinosus TaxID=300112 RepID=A0A4S2LA69_9HYME|nr:hypothetical protein DBV15_05780 [Temnothorax longispinosus]
MYKLAVKENALLSERALPFFSEKRLMFCTALLFFYVDDVELCASFLQSRVEEPIKRTACTLSIYNIYMKVVSIYIALLKGEKKRQRYFLIERQAYSKGLREYFTTKRIATLDSVYIYLYKINIIY